MAIMKDGFSTTINFPDAPGVLAGVYFKEVTVKPPGLDSRGPIDITSMRNVRLVTKHPKQLTDVTDLTLSVQWDPAIYGRLINVLGIMRVNQRIYVIFPNGEIWLFYGYCDKFDPQDNAEGENPRANMTVVMTNVDPITGAEIFPLQVA